MTNQSKRIWVEYNPNPDTKKYTRGRKRGKTTSHGDCVVRAFTVLWNVDWATAYKRLCDRGLELCDMPSQRVVWKSFLNKSDINLKVKVRVPGDPRNTRQMTVKEVAKLTKDNDKVYLCHSLHHVVVCKDGHYYDSWDSGNESVRSLHELK